VYEAPNEREIGFRRRTGVGKSQFVNKEPMDDSTSQFLDNKMAYRAGQLFANDAQMETTREVNIVGDVGGGPPTLSRRERLQQEMVLEGKWQRPGSRRERLQQEMALNDASQRVERWKAIDENQRQFAEQREAVRDLHTTTGSQEAADMRGGKKGHDSFGGRYEVEYTTETTGLRGARAGGSLKQEDDRFGGRYEVEYTTETTGLRGARAGGSLKQEDDRFGGRYEVEYTTETTGLRGARAGGSLKQEDDRFGGRYEVEYTTETTGLRGARAGRSLKQEDDRFGGRYEVEYTTETTGLRAARAGGSQRQEDDRFGGRYEVEYTTETTGSRGARNRFGGRNEIESTRATTDLSAARDGGSQKQEDEELPAGLKEKMLANKMFVKSLHMFADGVAQPSGTRTMIDKKTEIKRLPQTEIVTSVSTASSARDMKKALLEESQQASRNEYEVSRTGSSLMRARQQRLQTKLREEAGIVEYDQDQQDQDQLGRKGQQREQNKMSRGGEIVEYRQEQVGTKGSEMGVYAGNWSEDDADLQQEDVQQEDDWSRTKRYKETDFMYDSDKSPRLYITKKMYYPSGHDWMDNMTTREVKLYMKKDEVEVEEECDEDYVQRRLAAAKTTKKKKEEYFVIENNWMDDMTREDVLYHREWNFSVSPKMARQGGEEVTVTRTLEGTAGAGVVEDSDVEGMLHTSKAVKSLMKHKMFVAAGKIFASDVGILDSKNDKKEKK